MAQGEQRVQQKATDKAIFPSFPRSRVGTQPETLRVRTDTKRAFLAKNRANALRYVSHFKIGE